MKRKISLVLSTLIGAMFFLVATAIAAPMLHFSYTAPTEGDTFTVQVLMDLTDPGDEITNFGFNIDFDAGWTLDSAIVNADLFDDMSGFGTDVAGFASLFPTGDLFGTDVLLASLTFTAQTAGDFDLRIYSDPSNFNEGIYTLLGNGDQFTAFDINLSETITVASASVPVPEPSIMFLLGSGGLAMIPAFRKKKQTAKPL